MKRILTITRAHGVRGLWVRAFAYGGSVLRRCAGVVASSIRERQGMRLSRRHEGLQFIEASHPLVSVLVAGGGDYRYVNRCLRALHRLQTEAALEIFVACDPALESRMDAHSGIHILSHSSGAPLAQLLLETVSRARGPYVYTIDSRAMPASGAISWLAAALDRDETVACASSQIRSFSGSLREAGRTISGEGKILAEGVGASRSDSRFAFVRDVASVSPASFMTKKEPLKDALSRGNAFRSVSYAVADLSFELRLRGKRCIYQPLSRVLCERSEEGADDLHESQLFAAKWLQGGRRDGTARRRLLVLDEHVPFEDRDAGSRRLAALLRFARNDGWSVTFGSVERRAYAPYFQDLAQDGIEPILGFTAQTLALLTERGFSYEYIWLCRPQIAEAFIGTARELQPRAKIVYDTIDLHHLRLSRQSNIASSPVDWKSMERRELNSARRSDVVVVTSQAEVEVLRQADGVRAVAVVGLAEPLPESVASPIGRSGVLFIGNYAHAPNVDAACWLATEIMPRVWQRIPDAQLTLAGADPTPDVKRLASRRIAVPGFVANLEPLLNEHRVFAAPLRFGAGLKGKIIQALAAGIPVVTTGIGAEGILREPNEMVIANDPESFAAAIAELYSDDAKWAEFSNGGRRAALRFSPEVQAEQLRAVLGSAV